MAGLSFERVQIDGFRGLRGLDLDGLGRVNILIGANDSGKTSVLEALSILCRPYEPSEWQAMLRRRDFGSLDEALVYSLRWCFTQSGGLSAPDELFSGRCEIDCQGRFPLRKLAINYSEFNSDFLSGFEELIRQRHNPADNIGEPQRPEPAARFVYDVTWDDGADDGSLPGNRSPNGVPINQVCYECGFPPSLPDMKSPSWASLPCETLTPYSYQINRFQVRAQSEQFFSDDPDQTLRMLQGFDSDVLDVRVLSLRGDRPAIYVKHRRLGVAPLSVFGDAMRRCVLLAATLPRLKDGGVLLIDEVETGIHVKALGRVFQWLIESARQLNVQIFVTTHSLEALDAIILAPAAQEGDVVAFRLSHADGFSKVKRFAGDILLGLRQERGLDLR